MIAEASIRCCLRRRRAARVCDEACDRPDYGTVNMPWRFVFGGARLADAHDEQMVERGKVSTCTLASPFSPVLPVADVLVGHLVIAATV